MAFDFPYLKKMSSFSRNEKTLGVYVALLLLAEVQLISCKLYFDIGGVKFVNVSCSFRGMTVDMKFQDLFTGTIFSHGNYFNPNCRYVAPIDGTKDVSYFMPLTDCGNILRENGFIYVSNTIVLQKHFLFETDDDIFHNVTCKLPIHNAVDIQIASQEELPYHFKNEVIESWMDFYSGKDVLGIDIPNKLLVGDEFILAVHLKDGDGIYSKLAIDVCWSHDEEDISVSENVVQVFDACQKSKWINGFNLTKGWKHDSDTVVYGTLKAFKFQYSTKVYFTCSIQACPNECINICKVPEAERFFDHRTRFKRSDQEYLTDRSLIERNRLMKATIHALSAKLLERNRVLAGRDSSFLKRASEEGNESVKFIPVQSKTHESIYTTEGASSTYINLNVYFYNLTNSVVVVTDNENNYRFVHSDYSEAPSNCIPKTRFVILTCLLGILCFTLILACICLILHVRKAKKVYANEHYQMYGYY